jgi:MGT family glycosyltransferase
MARLLFTVWPFPTHLHPFLALAREASSQGHEVAFYTGGGALSVVAREGFRCFPFREVEWGRVSGTVDDLIAGRKRPAQMRRLWPRFLVETVPAQVRDLEAVLAEWPADALVCDIAMWAPILILRERMGVPVIAFSHVAHSILPGPDGPIQGIALPRRRNAWQAVYAAVAARAANVITARTRRKANALRGQFGLAPLNVGVNAFTGTLPLYLVPGAPEFDNLRSDLPASVSYVGPCLWDKHRDQAPPAWLERTLARIPRHRPVVLVDEGALYTHEPRVLQMAARALANLPLTVILLAGEGRVMADLKFGPLASNVEIHPHAPLSDVLPMADLLVSNGNSESVLAALQAGLPVVVLPSIWDQAEMAWRVAETGVGLRISPSLATPGRMRRAVLRVLAEAAFGDNAARMGAVLAHCGGPARASALIAGLVRCPQRTSAL